MLAVLLAWSWPGHAHAATALPAGWHKGANFTAWWHDAYEKPEAEQQLAALRSTGATHVAFVVTWYMDGADSATVAADPQKTPTAAGLRAVIAKAKAMGMTVMLKPHVDVRDGTFRGLIRPSDPDGWFQSYSTLMLEHADLAQQAGADLLVVGTELTSMSGHARDWRDLIAAVRQRFAGRLTFAANWTDGAAKVPFWAQLDYIGVDGYMPLLDGEPLPSTEQLAAALCSTTTKTAGRRGYVAETQDLHRRYGKQVLFTELGYRSQLGAASTPWADTGAPTSPELQQRAYEAAYRVWSAAPWVAGLYWWDWPAGAGVPAPTSYTPFSKPAGATMTQWNTAGALAPGTAPCNARGRPGGVRSKLALRTRRLGDLKDGRVRRFSGRFRQGRDGCGQAVVIRVERRSRRRAWHRQMRFKLSPRSSGRFRTTVPGRRMPRGRYRARAWASGKPCGSKRSPYVRFRVR